MAASPSELLDTFGNYLFQKPLTPEQSVALLATISRGPHDGFETCIAPLAPSREFVEATGFDELELVNEQLCRWIAETEDESVRTAFATSLLATNLCWTYMFSESPYYLADACGALTAEVVRGTPIVICLRMCVDETSWCSLLAFCPNRAGGDTPISVYAVDVKGMQHLGDISKVTNKQLRPILNAAFGNEGIELSDACSTYYYIHQLLPESPRFRDADISEELECFPNSVKAVFTDENRKQLQHVLKIAEE